MPRKAHRTAGAALSDAVLSRFTLDPHEEILLREAARTADSCADLQAVVDKEGPMVMAGRTRRWSSCGCSG